MTTPGRRPAFNRRSLGMCERCGKQSYETRGQARAAKRITHPGEKMTVYRCGDYYHFGHNEGWRDRLPDDLVWKPLPPTVVAQMRKMGEKA